MCVVCVVLCFCGVIVWFVVVDCCLYDWIDLCFLLVVVEYVVVFDVCLYMVCF